MKAQETTFQALVQGEKQFQIPLYQRTYSWTREQLDQLWVDIVAVADDLAAGEQTTHFVGSVVLAPSPFLSAAGLQPWVVIDGQQRLTTLMLAMCALRDHVAQTEPTARERINDLYLINKYRKENEHYRLLPTKADREAFISCIEGSPERGGADPIGHAYRFFLSALEQADDPADPHDITRIESVICQRLSIVEITAQVGDNAHRIFESLNNTGMQLSQADLLRNHLFMMLPQRGEHVYDHVWLPMQRRLTASQLEDLFFYDLILAGDERARRNDLFRRQQTKIARQGTDEAAVEGIVNSFAQRARLLERIVDPAAESDTNLGAAFARLRSWQAQVAYPVLIAFLERLEDGRTTIEQTRAAVDLIESFLVRRMICGVTSANLNKILSALVGELDESAPLDEVVRKRLSVPRRNFMSDSHVRDAVKARPFYWQGRADQRMMILKRIEKSYETNEPADLDARLSVEHVLPQTLTPEWAAMLADGPDGQTPEETHRRLLHTLGNLTLSGYNSQLSNHPFDRKQQLYQTSGLHMNRPIAEAGQWGAAEIEARSDDLATRIIVIWPGPVEGVADSARKDWTLLHAALAALPAGGWTTYGDVAALVGSHPVPVGQYLASKSVINAYRVLQTSGRVSPGFRWLDPDDDRDPIDVMKNDGVPFAADGSAEPDARCTARDLAELVGLDVDDEIEIVEMSEISGMGARSEQFFGQMASRQGPVISQIAVDILETWRELGGSVAFGKGARDTSAQLSMPGNGKQHWMIMLYPSSGTAEVQFKLLSGSPPFDDVTIRNELRTRLNGIEGIDLPADRLLRRPSFPIESLGNDEALKQFRDVCLWFGETVRVGG